jgi:hypothetical protein
MTLVAAQGKRSMPVVRTDPELIQLFAFFNDVWGTLANALSGSTQDNIL